ncbi:hypothetical protein HETIRDRAFT_331304 [Heterobasidion irregulare TC 32-1]|uniref:Uncharacterized protein n=1 Tax=Heterobasidion irregulare (strain TC 32-1) TaxID=747525 RepID=W4JQ79_HETIT|nr:uncharacterized protein HETIRDRAFT_331304 [Heterobasidion irregulare TC 32-1]ETW75629.1 hypothetical protein HETIRDRAFT_331304 [Heterobasidion irregulare TC 32-1]
MLIVLISGPARGCGTTRKVAEFHEMTTSAALLLLYRFLFLTDFATRGFRRSVLIFASHPQPYSQHPTALPPLPS